MSNRPERSRPPLPAPQRGGPAAFATALRERQHHLDDTATGEKPRGDPAPSCGCCRRGTARGERAAPPQPRPPPPGRPAPPMSTHLRAGAPCAAAAFPFRVAGCRRVSGAGEVGTSPPPPRTPRGAQPGRRLGRSRGAAAASSLLPSGTCGAGPGGADPAQVSLPSGEVFAHARASGLTQLKEGKLTGGRCQKALPRDNTRLKGVSSTEVFSGTRKNEQSCTARKWYEDAQAHSV